MVPYVRCTMGARARMKAQSHVHGLMSHVKLLLCVTFWLFPPCEFVIFLVPCGLQTVPEGFEVAVHAMSASPEVACGLLNDAFDIHQDAPLVRAISLGHQPSIPNYMLCMRHKWLAPFGAQASLQAFVHRIPSTHCTNMLVLRMPPRDRDTRPSADVCRPKPQSVHAWPSRPWPLRNLPSAFTCEPPCSVS